MLRCFAGLLAAVLFLLVVGCTTDTPQEADTTTAEGSATTQSVETDPVETVANDVAELPERNFNNETLKVLMRNNAYYISDMFIDDVTASSNTNVDRAVYYRNVAVQQKYGITMEYSKSSDSNLDYDQVNAILTGSCEYDLIANHGRGMFTYAMNGCLKNWCSLPYVDLDKIYWSQGMVNDFTIKGCLFCLSGDLSYQSLGATVCTIMNDKVFDNVGLSTNYSPYEEVEEGTWTLELFMTLCESADADINGDGAYKVTDKDIMGYVTSKYRGPLTLLYAAGGSVTEKDDNGDLILTLYNSKNVEVYDTYFGFLFGKENNALLEFSGSFLPNFAVGNVLFTDARLYDISQIVNAGMTEFSVLPFPKYDTSVDEYYSWCDAVGNTFGVPSSLNADRYEFIGFALEALSYQGHVTVIPAFYEKTLQLKYSRTVQASEVMDIIKAGRKYDVASYMSAVFGKLDSPGTYLCVEYQEGRNFTSWYKDQETSVSEKIQTANDYFTNLASLQS